MFLKKVSKETKIAGDKDILLVNFPSSSRFAESYRTLRTNLFFSIMEKDLTSIVVTSSVEGEGKTTTCVNLAYTIAQAGRSVLLVDMDLRRPHLSSLFNLKKNEGVSDLIVDVIGTRLTSGSLTSYSIDDLVTLSRLQGRTCRIDLENETTQVAVFFEKGKLIDLYWKNRPDSKKLASTLIKNNLLTEKEAYLALGHQKKSVQRLGTILYTMGFVSKKDIAKALSVHTIEAIKAVLAMDNGHFRFSPLSVAEIKQSLSQDIDFERLYQEFNISPSDDNFLKKSIEAAIQPTGVMNLSVLPSGSVPPNPSELVGSERTRFLIDCFKQWYDFVIIDTPPVMPATDALLTAPRTDGTILVVRARSTDRKIIKEVVGKFQSAGQPIIGTVLNRVNMKREGYYKYYKKYYSSYYGDK